MRAMDDVIRSRLARSNDPEELAILRELIVLRDVERRISAVAEHGTEPLKAWALSLIEMTNALYSQPKE